MTQPELHVDESPQGYACGHCGRLVLHGSYEYCPVCHCNHAGVWDPDNNPGRLDYQEATVCDICERAYPPYATQCSRCENTRY